MPTVLSKFTKNYVTRTHIDKKTSHTIPYLENIYYEKCAEVMQQGFGITNYENEKPFISTYGMSSCIGIVGYSEKYKLAFILHLDNKNIIFDKNMGKIYFNIRKAIKNNSDGIILNTQLFGAFQTYNQEFVNYIYSQINKYNNYYKNLECPIKINIIKNNIGTSNNSSSICINTINGKLYKYDPRKGNLNTVNTKMLMFELRILSNLYTNKPKLYIDYKI
jgi:hypothetical protein